MGVLLVAPFLLSLLPRPALPRLSWRRVAELGGLLAGTAIVTYLLFQSGLRLVYLVLPLIMATAWRFRQRGATPAALIASTVAIWSAVHGTGPLASETLLAKMVTLQAFNVSLALASFVLVAFVETRERSRRLEHDHSERAPRRQPHDHGDRARRRRERRPRIGREHDHRGHGRLERQCAHQHREGDGVADQASRGVKAATRFQQNGGREAAVFVLSVLSVWRGL